MKRVLTTLATGLALSALMLSRIDTPTVRAAAPDTLTWEAEDANTIDEPFKKRTGRRRDKTPRPQDNSGSGYIEIPDKANGDKKEGDGSELPGVALYKVNVAEAGQYKLWGRCLWPNGCGNSFFMRKQGRPKQTFGEDGTYDAWHWVKLSGPDLALAKGVNVIEVLNREDGVLLDQIQVTTGPRVPTGKQPVTPNVLAD